MVACSQQSEEMVPGTQGSTNRRGRTSGLARYCMWKLAAWENHRGLSRARWTGSSRQDTAGIEHSGETCDEALPSLMRTVDAKRSRTHIHTADKLLYHELLIYSMHTGEKRTHSNKCNFEVLVS